MHKFIITIVIFVALILAAAVPSKVVRAQSDVPVFKNQKYKRIPPFEAIDKEIESLIWGVTKKINPKFDPYGNELRRYMARVGVVDVMVQATEREKQFDNVKAAKQILKNWKTHMGGQIIAIEKRLEKYPPSQRKVLQDELSENLKVIANFYLIVEGWVDANLDLLTFLRLSQDEFDPINPVKGFKNSDTQDTFNTLLQKRNTARDLVRAYPPFDMMLF